MMRRLSVFLLIVGLVCTLAVPQAQAATTYYLSDLNWVGTPVNGSGPVEKDHAVGEWNTVGGTLTMQGTTWAKGLGAHAASEIKYNLGGVCQTFTAMVGVDDEIGNNGSVIFRVFADGVQIHDSGTIGGANTARSVSVDISGKNELKLVVTDAGDGIGWDHADWADAKVSCTSAPGSPAPTPTPPPAAQGTPRLIKDYYVHQPLAANEDIYDDIIYRPAGFKNGLTHFTDTCYVGAGCTNGQQKWTVNSVDKYGNFDVLAMADESPTLRQNTGSAAFDFTLTRPATVYIIKLATESMPQLASGNWVQDGVVNISGGFRPNEANVYKKSFPAGKVDMPGPSPDGRAVIMYWVLLGEGAGTPSVYPTAPSGQTQPVANTTCPNWVHDQHVTTAPDGRIYPTWHPQIDPVYWCYFRHEHGSDPALFHPDYHPPYGYAAVNGGENEPHPGFKGFLMPPENGYQSYVTIHLGSSGMGRLCNRFHEMQVALKEMSSGELAVNTAYLADFGRSLDDPEHDHAYYPTACPNQANISEPTGGSRVIPNISIPGGNRGYEPWTQDTQYTCRVLGQCGDYSINVTQPINICPDTQCATPFRNALNTGTGRFILHGGTGWKATANVGTFYTDAKGRNVVPAGTAGALKQYVKAGLNAVFNPHPGGFECYDVYGFGRAHVCGGDDTVPSGGSQEREGSLLLPDGSANN